MQALFLTEDDTAIYILRIWCPSDVVVLLCVALRYASNLTGPASTVAKCFAKGKENMLVLTARAAAKELRISSRFVGCYKFPWQERSSVYACFLEPSVYFSCLARLHRPFVLGCWRVCNVQYVWFSTLLDF